MMAAVLTQTIRRITSQEIPIQRIEPNPFQARHVFTDIGELAAAILQQGFTSRLRVRPHPQKTGYYQLVYGERRLRAAQEAGLATLPCDVVEQNDEEMIEIGLAENIQRKDLNPLEEAEAFKTLIERRGYTIRSLAERIGKHKDYVDSRLGLLRAPPDVQAVVKQRPDSVRAAREIAKVPTPEARKPLLEGVVRGELTTTDVRAEVRKGIQPSVLSVYTDKTGEMAAVQTPLHPRNSERMSALSREVQRVAQTFDSWQALVEHLTVEERVQFLRTVEVLRDQLNTLGGELRHR